MTTHGRRNLLLAAAALLSVAFLYAGAALTPASAPPRVHPLTGRQIAGIATDAAWLDRGSREAEEAPDTALALLNIRPGMVVADVGAGTGYMTVHLARLVGDTGRVYANDIQPAMLAIIRRKADEQRLTNVIVVEGTESDAKLPAGSIDLALLVDVYHELSNPGPMLSSVRRSLKPDGHLVLVEYRAEDAAVPIAPTHRMSVAEARTEVEADGFRFDRLISDLPRQHIIMFAR
jgi:SAM-dependent methyltransferase